MYILKYFVQTINRKRRCRKWQTKTIKINLQNQTKTIHKRILKEAIATIHKIVINNSNEVLTIEKQHLFFHKCCFLRFNLKVI